MKVLSKPVYVTYTGYLKYDLIEVGSFTRNTKTPRVSDLLDRPEIVLDIVWILIPQNLKNLKIYTSKPEIYTSNHVYLYFKIPYLYFNFIFLYFKSWS